MKTNRRGFIGGTLAAVAALVLGRREKAKPIAAAKVDGGVYDLRITSMGSATGGTVWIDAERGDDSTAVVNNPHRPFRTFEAASEAMGGGTYYVSGQFNPTPIG